MPDLNPSSSPPSSLALIPHPIFVKPILYDQPKLQDSENSSSNSLWDSHSKDVVKENGNCENRCDRSDCNGTGILNPPNNKLEKMQSKSLAEYVKEWVQRKINAGVSENKCYFPFLLHAPKLSRPRAPCKPNDGSRLDDELKHPFLCNDTILLIVAECHICRTSIYSKEEKFCSVRGCQVVCHITCATERLGLSSAKSFKCLHHVCYLCKEKINLWRCVRCQIASHNKCAAFKEHVMQIPDHPGQAICWRHPIDWRLDGQKTVPANNIEDTFSRLPLPYVEEEFQIDMNWKNIEENTSVPPPYVHIRRNMYLVKKKKDDTGAGIGCTNCRSTECQESCVCRVQCISCSKACRCSDACTNRPFRKDKKIRVVKTALCGWGVVAAESIKKGDFIIEYIGEVINDATCEQRLWDMKYKSVKNFYMCEIRKDFTIDATFKGNSSRFLNHSCEPNCELEKWQVEGETRVGVFAARSIQAGEPLTYDYRFVQFGPEVKCHCGAPNCQGYLGTKKKMTVLELDLCWGSKRKRTDTACLSIIKL